MWMAKFMVASFWGHMIHKVKFKVTEKLKGKYI